MVLSTFMMSFKVATSHKRTPKHTWAPLWQAKTQQCPCEMVQVYFVAQVKECLATLSIQMKHISLIPKRKFETKQDGWNTKAEHFTCSHRQGKMRLIFSKLHFETVIHAFVATCTNVRCGSLAFVQLGLVQNAAVGLLTRTMKYKQISRFWLL